jgi:hypothetical protein
MRPTLEVLEERAVPSAATVDLTTVGAQGSINGAVFQQSDPQPTGCGVIHDFLRIQAHGSSVQQGYNTDGRPLQFDEKTSPTFTRSIQLNNVPVVLVNGVAYREFLLGINQSQSSPLLSLDKLQIFLGDRGDLTGYDSGSGTLAGLSPIYDMNAGGDHWVALNAALSHGNGSGDMFLLVPDRFFVTPAGNPNPFVTVYSEFGVNFGANGGFEQWALPAQTGVSPFGSLSGFVYFDTNQNGIFDTGDTGLGGVVITLTGVNDQGAMVTFTTTTDLNGFYQFTSLRPGTYTITKTPPPGYVNGAENLGTLGGQVALNAFTQVVLGANQAGLNYDFGELLFQGS